MVNAQIIKNIFVFWCFLNKITKNGYFITVVRLFQNPDYLKFSQ